MTPLLHELTAGPKSAELAPHIAVRDFDTVAAIISAGRLRANEKLVGIGLVLDTLGITAGNAFLDAFYADNTFRHAWKLMDQAALQVSLPLVQQTIQLFVPGVLTQEQADALKALGFDPDPVSAAQCAAAIDGGV